MPGLSILIVEDEPVLARRVERLTRDCLGDRVASVQIVDAVEPGIAILQSQPVDLLLLDLNLRGEDGFHILETVSSFAAQTIIVSAYAERAARAFDYGVIDFVTKPFEAERLELALQRFTGMRAPRAERARVLSFRTGRRLTLVQLDEVSLIRGADKYSEVVLESGETRLHDKPLGQLAALLPEEFMRVHKSCIARIDRMVELVSSPGNRHEIIMRNGERAPVSRSLIGLVRALFQ